VQAPRLNNNVAPKAFRAAEDQATTCLIKVVLVLVRNSLELSAGSECPKSAEDPNPRSCLMGALLPPNLLA
jgi:hypothetical protein